MAGAATSDPNDRAFAEEAGYNLASSLSGGGVQMRVRSRLAAGQMVLSQVGSAVSDYLGVPIPIVDDSIGRLIAREIGEILESIEITTDIGVPTLVGLDNGFDIDPVVNVLDGHTLHHLDIGDGSRFSILGRRRFDAAKAESNPRIELIEADSARRGLFTLLADSIRFLFGGGGGGTPEFFSFTVHTEKPGYVLNSTPEWAIDFTRFGNKKTYPVTGRLRSGRYYFEGRKGSLVERDDTLIVVGPANTSTVLDW